MYFETAYGNALTTFAIAGSSFWAKLCSMDERYSGSHDFPVPGSFIPDAFQTSRCEARTEFLSDIIIGAIERGTGYWAELSHYQYVDEDGNVRVVYLGRGFDDRHDTVAMLHELDVNGTQYKDEGMVVDIDAVAKGIAEIVNGGIRINNQLRDAAIVADRKDDASYIDSELADCIVQAALLGEIRYG